MRDSNTTKFHAVAHRGLAEEIADQIERLILNHELRIGDALPAERELAEQLGVSRNMLREAIRMLVQKGLLEVRPGSGTFVAQPSAQFLADILDFYMRFRGSAMFDLLEARRSLEVEIAGLAAERAGADDIEGLGESLDEMIKNAADPQIFVQADLRFHEQLAEAARNEILQLLIGSMRTILRRNMQLLATHHPAGPRVSIDYHRKILAAIRASDAAAARLAMREHLEQATAHLRDLEAQGIDFSQ